MRPYFESITGPGGSEFSRKEVVRTTGMVLGEYATRASDALRDIVRSGGGKQILGSVNGRPDDEQLGVDAYGEHILTNVIREFGLSATVIGEHNRYDLGDGRARVTFSQDSFDNTSQYKRGLDTSPYSVVGAFLPNGKPIGAVILDIKDRRVYASLGSENHVVDLETGQTEKLTPSTRTTITDRGFTLATYLGSNEYSSQSIPRLDKLRKAMHPKGVLYAGGGAYIYGLLAAGAVDAYIMYNEPLSEVYPGLPLATAAGISVVSVNEDGSYEEIQFDPKRYGDTIPFYIAACTPEVRDEIICYDRKQREELRESEKDLRRARFVRERYEGEFEESERQLEPSSAA